MSSKSQIAAVEESESEWDGGYSNIRLRIRTGGEEGRETDPGAATVIA
jgi:hypothetical protein